MIQWTVLYRYIGESIKGSITVVRKTNPGAQVPIKLCHFVRAKCHPMLYDLRINSPSTIRLNGYQTFLLCAMKFHAYLCSMERTCHHSPFLFKAIEVTSRYVAVHCDEVYEIKFTRSLLSWSPPLTDGCFYLLQLYAWIVEKTNARDWG